ncbi:hypothetical protein MHBO_004665, partial [Bonamia ostreae]
IEILGTDVSKSKSEVDELLATLQKLNKENTTLQEGLIGYRSECERLTTKLAEFEQLQARCVELEQKLSEAFERDAQSDQLNTELRNIIGQREEKLMSYDQHIASLKTRNTELENQVIASTEELNTRIQAGAQANNTISIQLGDVMNDNQRLESAKNALEERLRYCETESNRLGGIFGECEQLRAQCGTLEQKISNMTEVVKEKEERIDQL